MQKARELWDSIMTKGNAKYANMWLEYYNLERSVVFISLCSLPLMHKMLFRSFSNYAGEHDQQVLHKFVEFIKY